MDGTPISLQCTVCSTSFSGPIPARQHFDSAEHKRKEALAQSGAKDTGFPYCSVCNKQCDTLQQLRAHQQSPRHLAMVEKKRALETQKSYHHSTGGGGDHGNGTNKDYVFDGSRGYCYLCRIDLTSQSHAKDHINGKNHQKKVVQTSNMKHMSSLDLSGSQPVNISPLVQSQAFSQSALDARYLETNGSAQQAVGAAGGGTMDGLSCSICNATFTGPQCAEQHYSSAKHIKKVQQQGQPMNIPAPAHSPASTTNSVTFEENNMHCSVCNVNFSGPDNARMHYSSDKHKRKVDMARYGRPQFYCDLCKVPFPGPDSQEVHNKSERHKKIVKLEEMKRRGEEVPMSCNACGTRFTGIESAEAHFNSKKHTANMRNMQLKSPHKDDSPNSPQIKNNFYPVKNINLNAQYKQEPQDKTIAITTEEGHTEFIAKPFPVEQPQQEYTQYSNQTSVKTVFDDTEPKHSDSQFKLQQSAAPSTESSPSMLKVNFDSHHHSDQGSASMISSRTCDDVPSGESNESHPLLSSPPVHFVQNELFSSTRGKGRGFLSLNISAYESLPGRSLGQNKKSDQADHSFSRGREEFLAKPFIDSYRNGAANNDDEKETADVTDPDVNALWNTLWDASPVNVNIPHHSRQAETQNASNPNLQRDFFFDSVSERGRCHVCNIDLTSRNHMQQHTTGKNHLKACTVSKQITAADEGNPNVCTICRVTFTGLENRKQHLDSAKHQAKARQLESGGTEFYCDVCMVQCSGELSFQQHLAGTQHRRTVGTPNALVPNAIDKTVWYHCDVCNCSLNSTEQLSAHKKSPKHLAKLQKVNPQEMPAQVHFSETPSPKASSSSTNRGLNQACGSFSLFGGESSMNPLESFLSEELFPAEYLPEDVKMATPELAKPKIDPVVTNGPLPPHQDRFACAVDSNATPDVTGSGQGSSSRSTGSELAFATRSRGTREHGASTDNPSRGSSVSRSPTEHLMNIQGFTNKAVSPVKTEQGVNPYAATHRYYCHTCKSPMNTRESYESHLKGKRHLARVSTEPAPVRHHNQSHSFDSQYIPCSKTQARSYQLELFRKALQKDTLCFLPTGTGKTLVSVLTISAMLEKCPSKNVLFLVDKVLLVLQQSKYIQHELQDIQYYRTDYTTEDCSNLVQRPVTVAAVCMGQQNTNGIPLWKHDVVVVTAAFCQNLLDKRTLRWEDFSLVVFDEAHHCEKGHPFNSLLQNYHNKITNPDLRPKVLGLTASPAGKGDVNKTLQMLQMLVQNMGGVRMGIVDIPENVQELASFQSNARLVIKSQGDEGESSERILKQEFCVYILHCYLRLLSESNIRYYLGNLDSVRIGMAGEDVRQQAETFVEKNLDTIQSSLPMIETTGLGKVDFSLLTCHVRDVCMALNSLEEGGPLCALEEIIEMQSTDQNFAFARSLRLPCETLESLLINNADDDGVSTGSDVHIRRLVEELTDMTNVEVAADPQHKPISLVLVKQRATAHRICKVLQGHERMKQLGLNTAMVVGHGTSGAEDKGMSVPQQKRVLEEIKQFKYQVIVATSVAEEGVDWPECQRVVSLYPPSTVTALVQMRGRARKKNSKFIVLCSNPQEEEKLRDILKREENMKIAAQMLACQSR